MKPTCSLIVAAGGLASAWLVASPAMAAAPDVTAATAGCAAPKTRRRGDSIPPASGKQPGGGPAQCATRRRFPHRASACDGLGRRHTLLSSLPGVC